MADLLIIPIVLLALVFGSMNTNSDTRSGVLSALLRARIGNADAI